MGRRKTVTTTKSTEPGKHGRQEPGAPARPQRCEEDEFDTYLLSPSCGPLRPEYKVHVREEKT